MKRKEMLKFLDELRKQHNDDTSIIAINEIENALTEKKYGLVWEEHEERVDKELKTKIPVFTEVEDKEIIMDKEKPYNFLIEGDNLHSLYLLEKTHSGMIDLIYIDPPYNTGKKDFIYDDDYINNDDEFRHSKWISFMNKRLRMARQLLSDEGVIFVSIGDDEVSQLKQLMDEIFGEDNYINLVAVKTKNAAGASGGGEDKKLKKNIEFLLIYSKNSLALQPFETVYKKTEIEELLNYYKENNISWKYTSVIYDRGKKKYVGSTYDGSGDEIKIFKRINTEFKSVNQISKIENISIKEVYYKYFDDIFTTAMPQSSIRKRVLDYIGTENLDKDSVYSIEYIPKSGRNKGKIYEQFYKGKRLRLFAWLADVGHKDETGVYKKDIEGTYWDGIELNNLSKEGNVVFSNGKKPLSLITRIINMIGKKDLVCLDFFAGSGTTGHAILDLNKKDGGNRKFILCTNNENNICEEITYQRMLNIKEDYNFNLKYYKTDYIDRYGDENLYISDELMNHIKEMVQLENHIKIDNEKYIIFYNEDDVFQLIKDKDRLNKCEKIYKPSYIFFDTKQLKEINNCGIEVITIPEYYFANELKEVGEI
jgi:adenine-specific DNA-methyltransferase